jgi:hypothetical protein
MTFFTHLLKQINSVQKDHTFWAKRLMSCMTQLWTADFMFNRMNVRNFYNLIWFFTIYTGFWCLRFTQHLTFPLKVRTASMRKYRTKGGDASIIKATASYKNSGLHYSAVLRRGLTAKWMCWSHRPCAEKKLKFKRPNGREIIWNMWTNDFHFISHSNPPVFV